LVDDVTALYDLQRFSDAQESIYAQALNELKAGRKQTHWMWFIFPQMAGLGNSPMAIRYAINSREEAQAYLDHPRLGSRLRECAAALLDVQGRTANQIMGFPDDLKLKSSMTLFATLPNADPVFRQVLERYFRGEQDEKTLQLLSG
jgi:uncharacterized protein (DUF1810 family)